MGSLGLSLVVCEAWNVGTKQCDSLFQHFQLQGLFKLLPSAEVVKWQTRTFEGRVAQAVRVQVPPSAPN